MNEWDQKTHGLCLAIKEWREIALEKQGPREALFVFSLVLVLILMILQGVSLLTKIILQRGEI